MLRIIFILTVCSCLFSSCVDRPTGPYPECIYSDTCPDDDSDVSSSEDNSTDDREYPSYPDCYYDGTCFKSKDTVGGGESPDTIVVVSGGTFPDVLCPIPLDALIRESYVNMRDVFSTPYQYEIGIEGVSSDYSHFGAGIAWLQAVYQSCEGVDAGYVDFRRLELRYVLRGGRKVIASTIDAGGLYGGDGYADPWYGKAYERFTFNVPDESLGRIPMELLGDSGGAFVRMRPYTGPSYDKLFHWWTARAELPDDLDYIEVVAVIRVTGSVWVQIGGDFWLNMTAPYTTYGDNTIESCVGDWYGESNTSGWATIKMSSNR